MAWKIPAFTIYFQLNGETYTDSEKQKMNDMVHEVCEIHSRFWNNAFAVLGIAFSINNVILDHEQSSSLLWKQKWSSQS